MIVRVWFAKQQADKGLPWYYQIDDQPAELCDNFMFPGHARPVFASEGAKGLPEGPRGYIEIEVFAAPTGRWARFIGWLARRAGWRVL